MHNLLDSVSSLCSVTGSPMATTLSKRRRKPPAKPVAPEVPQWVRIDDTDPINGQQQVHFSLDCATTPQIELIIGVFQGVDRKGKLIADLWDVELCAWVNGDSDSPLYADEIAYKDTLTCVLLDIPRLQHDLTRFAAHRLVALAGSVAATLSSLTP